MPESLPQKPPKSHIFDLVQLGCVRPASSSHEATASFFQPATTIEPIESGSSRPVATNPVAGVLRLDVPLDRIVHGNRIISRQALADVNREIRLLAYPDELFMCGEGPYGRDRRVLAALDAPDDQRGALEGSG